VTDVFVTLSLELQRQVTASASLYLLPVFTTGL